MSYKCNKLYKNGHTVTIFISDCQKFKDVTRHFFVKVLEKQALSYTAG